MPETGRTILVVDDHASNREYLATLLGYRGYRVLEAGDGADALELAKAENPDLIIADILMPAMDGYQLVQHLRAEPAIAETRVMFYTATYLEEEARDLAAHCGVSHILTKPSNPEDVLRMVEDALGQDIAITTTLEDSDFNEEHLRLITDKLASLSQNLGEVSERFAELIDLNLQLASERNPKRLLHDMCGKACKLIGASHALLVVGPRNGENTLFFTTSGLDAAAADRIETPALRAGMMDIVFTRRQSLRGRTDGSRAPALPAGYPPASNYLVSPIVSTEHTYGWICLTDRLTESEFSREDEHLLSILAAQVGRIYENGSLYADLQEQEERFRQLAENIREVFFLRDASGDSMLYISPTYETVWGRSRESLYANPHSWIDSVYPDDYEYALSHFNQTVRDGKFDFTYRIVRPNGEIRWIRTRGFPIRNAAGELYRVAGIAEDVTERRQAEEKIRRLNRVYAVLSGINSAIVHIRDRQALFDEACRIAVEAGKFRMAWIGIVSEGKDKIIPQAIAGHETGYLEHLPLPVPTMASEPDLHSAGSEALRLLRPVVLNNIVEDSEYVPWQSEAIIRGYHAIAAFPLIISEAPSGVICLYAEEPDFFDADEMQLLSELASDIAFALEFIENEKSLNYLAFHHRLTGLANRTSLYNSLVDSIERRRGDRQPFALILMNINDFRDINFTLGHNNGDELLKLIAKRLHATVWETDIVASLGGDSFAVLLPHLSDKQHIDLVINKILTSFQNTFVISGIPVNVEATLGIALYPDHGENADLLWQHADVAHQSARELHHTHSFYDPAIDHYDSQKLSLIGELRGAIDRNELLLHYQPCINIQAGKTAGVEALVRWQHPDRGLIYPDEFIPLVERTGLINPLTTWVLANGLRQIYFWEKNGFPVELAVNLSVRNLQNPNLIGEILDLAGSSRLPPDRLTVEITETSIMVDPLHARKVLHKLSEAGIGISLDDFGTGQSSLTYLKNLPISKMKIDKSFVMQLDDPRNAAIVRAAIELGRSLGLIVTAEGVENEEAMRFLKELGCHQAQGYFFSKPLPPDLFIAWLRRTQQNGTA